MIRITNRRSVAARCDATYEPRNPNRMMDAPPKGYPYGPDWPLRMTELLFLDLETTGIRPDRRGGIEEIALLDRKRTVLHWQAKTDDAGSLRETLAALVQALDGHVVVGHNIGFDLHHLTHEAHRLDLPGPTVCAIDTLGLARRLQVPAVDYSLGALLRLFGKMPERPLHTARVDAAATRELLWQLVAYGNLTTLSDAGARPVHWVSS